LKIFQIPIIKEQELSGFYLLRKYLIDILEFVRSEVLRVLEGLRV
jgi:hypothetical protein